MWTRSNPGFGPVEARRSTHGKDELLGGVPPRRGGAVPGHGRATIAGIAADLGIKDATLSGWCRAAGVPVRGRRGSAAVPAPAADELARLRLENAELCGDPCPYSTVQDRCAREPVRSSLVLGPHRALGTQARVRREPPGRLHLAALGTDSSSRPSLQGLDRPV